MSVIFSMLLFAKESSCSCKFEKTVGTEVRPSPSIERTFKSESIDKSGMLDTFVLPMYSLWSFLKDWTTLRSVIGFYLTYKESRLGLPLIYSKLSISFSYMEKLLSWWRFFSPFRLVILLELPDIYLRDYILERGSRLSIWLWSKVNDMRNFKSSTPSRLVSLF